MAQAIKHSRQGLPVKNKYKATNCYVGSIRFPADPLLIASELSGLHFL